MKGFDAEFENLDHYIRVITDRIWEQRRIDDINKYYSEPCAVITPSTISTESIKHDLQSVIDGTRSTLAMFPDRRLLAEDVIQSGNEDTGFLSSHRIISPMTHLGDGMFGSATGRSVQVRTIADCVCKDNRIIHEWLVRDVGAIALHIGTTPQALAQTWLDNNSRTTAQLAKIDTHQPFYAPLPQGYESHITDNSLAVQYNGALQQFFTGDLDKIKQTADILYDQAVHQLGSNGSSQYGVAQASLYWHSVFGALTVREVRVDHSAHMRSGEPEKSSRPARTATRWIISATHSGDGRFGAASGKEIHIMGINHVEWLNGKVLREWVLIDEVAIWMQVLAAS